MQIVMNTKFPTEFYMSLELKKKGKQNFGAHEDLLDK